MTYNEWLGKESPERLAFSSELQAEKCSNDERIIMCEKWETMKFQSLDGKFPYVSTEAEASLTIDSASLIYMVTRREKWHMQNAVPLKRLVDGRTKEKKWEDELRDEKVQ